nr:hypothetical protein [Morchella crassipes]
MKKGVDLLFYLTLVELRSTNACLKKDMFFLNHPSLSNMDYSHNPGYDREGRAKKIKIKLVGWWRGGGGGRGGVGHKDDLSHPPPPRKRPLKGLCLPSPPPRPPKMASPPPRVHRQTRCTLPSLFPPTQWRGGGCKGGRGAPPSPPPQTLFSLKSGKIWAVVRDG